MGLFAENILLKSINDVLEVQIANFSLIGDLPISYDDFLKLASKIGIYYERNATKELYSIYKESLSVFLVFCAVYEYNEGTFWKPIEKYIGNVSNTERIKLYTIFTEVLIKYNLNPFENESVEGYTHVTPILCHAGIPITTFDTYFEAISNTVNDTFYDDFSVEDYLSYLQNKTEMTVKRYIKLTTKRDAFNFIQNTRKLLLCDSVENGDEMGNGNYVRMVDQISLWKEKPKNKKNLQARSNVRITAPKIKVDLNGVGIFCEIPKITLTDCYDSYIIWEVISDESTNIVKVDVFRRSGVLVSEEKIVIMKPSKSYTIALKVDDNLISKWEFDGVKNNYIAFTQNGNIIKTDTLPSNIVIILMSQNIDIENKEKLSIAELPKIPLWTEYNVYRMDLSNLKSLQCSGFNIHVNSEMKPILNGGEKLFNQENSEAYTELPYIKVPVLNEGDWHLEIKHKGEGNVLSKLNEAVSSDCEYIKLNHYINKGYYGEYDIKIWNRTGVNARFSIGYVPYSNIIVDENEYWPRGYQGYTNSIQKIRTGSGVELDIYNAEQGSEINHDGYTVYRYKVEDRDRFLIGEYRYSYENHTFTAPIKKCIHPISWSIIGIENEIIELTSKVYTLTIAELENAIDPLLLFSFDFDTKYDIRFLKFDLVGPDKNVVIYEDIAINNKDGLRIPLNSYLLEMKKSSEIDYHLRISLIDSCDMLVSSFWVARVQDEVVIENAKLRTEENDFSVTWEELGTRCGREFILLNFVKPWLAPYHFKIEDKSCEVKFSKEILDVGVYRYIIQKEVDDLFFEETESEICSLGDFQRGFVQIKGENNYSTDLEKVVWQILMSRFMKKEVVPQKLEQIASKISTIRLNIPEDIKYISYSYILNKRFFDKKEDTLIVDELFESLFNLFSKFCKETLKFVLDSDFSNKYKKELLHKFHCNNVTLYTDINNVQLKSLEDIDEDIAGFINLVQSDNNVKGLNWAGISDIEVLRGEDLFGEEEVNATFLSDENLGKSSYITPYYEYVYTTMLRPKNMSKSAEELIREFQKENIVKETMIFGKTRLHLLTEWNSNNKDAKKILDKLSYILKIPCEEALKEKFKEAFSSFTKRRAEDKLGYYIGLIALYASFIRNGLIDGREDFGDLLHYTIDKCDKLYYRDAIIIELHMKLERGLLWV